MGKTNIHQTKSQNQVKHFYLHVVGECKSDLSSVEKMGHHSLCRNHSVLLLQCILGEQFGICAPSGIVYWIVKLHYSFLILKESHVY